MKLLTLAAGRFAESTIKAFGFLGEQIRKAILMHVREELAS